MSMSFTVQFKLLGLKELCTASIAVQWSVNVVHRLLMLLKVGLAQKLLLTFFALMILPILMQHNVILKVGLLEKGCLANLALELLFAGVFLHVPGHILGGDGLATYVALSALLAFG